MLISAMLSAIFQKPCSPLLVDGVSIELRGMLKILRRFSLTSMRAGAFASKLVTTSAHGVAI